MIRELEQRFRAAEGLPLFERMDKCSRLSVEISVLLKDPDLDPADRIALTKLRARVRDVKHWWEPKGVVRRRKRGLFTTPHKVEPDES